MAKNDTYKEPIIIETENMVARVYIPVLTEEERKRRLEAIAKSAARLLESKGASLNKDYSSTTSGPPSPTGEGKPSLSVFFT